MSKNPTAVYETPVGDLEWVVIDGEGKEDLKGDMKYQINLVLEGDKAEAEMAKVRAFWEENRPKSIKEPKSMGFQPHAVKTEEKDPETDKWIYEETGKTNFIFKTGTTYNDGKQKVIKVFNAKGAEVTLGDKKIGNGSRGRIKGVMAIYTVESKGKIIDAGVTFYLNGVQLAKFVEFAGGPQFDEIEDEDADFEGVSDMGGIPDESSTATEDKAPAAKGKPRL